MTHAITHEIMVDAIKSVYVPYALFGKLGGKKLITVRGQNPDVEWIDSTLQKMTADEIFEVYDWVKHYNKAHP